MKSSVEKIKFSMKESKVLPKVTIKASTDYSLSQFEQLFGRSEHQSERIVDKKDKDPYNGCTLTDKD